MENLELLDALRSKKLSDITPQSRTEEMLLALHEKIDYGVDTSKATVTPETLLEGVTAHDAEGNPIVGTHVCVKDPNIITDFYRFCAGGCRLEDIKNISTSNGTNFSEMFSECSSLTSIPELDTSNGTDFRCMFYGCSSLTSIPELNTSKGTDFNEMFRECSSLTSIPELNTSNGTNFRSMFSLCSSLTSIPTLDTSKGTDFSEMFFGCSSLTTIPALNTRKNESFWNMFSGCSSLTAIPALDVRSTVDLSGMFDGCSSLTTVCLLNVDIISSFFRAFDGCYSLQNVTFTGSFDGGELDLSHSPLLTKDSITSVINTLSSTARGQAVTVSLTAVNNAFETSAGAGDGSTSDEWTALKATKSNWTIELMDSIE